MKSLQQSICKELQPDYTIPNQQYPPNQRTEKFGISHGWGGQAVKERVHCSSIQEIYKDYLDDILIRQRNQILCAYEENGYHLQEKCSQPVKQKIMLLQSILMHIQSMQQNEKGNRIRKHKLLSLVVEGQGSLIMIWFVTRD